LNVKYVEESTKLIAAMNSFLIILVERSMCSYLLTTLLIVKSSGTLVKLLIFLKTRCMYISIYRTIIRKFLIVIFDVITTRSGTIARQLLLLT